MCRCVASLFAGSLLVLVAVGCAPIDDDSTPGGLDAGADTGASDTWGADARSDVDASGADADVDPGPPTFAEAHFAATHNSYAGGPVGSLVGQLDGGVRFVELDIHEDDFATEGYRVGHDEPGNQVETGGDNPGSTALRAWLKVVSDWSDDHAGHAPITVGIDVKDDLSDNGSAQEGDLSAFNTLIDEVFGAKLLSAADVGGDPWPAVESMGDRVLVVLSGHGATRQRYRTATGGGDQPKFRQLAFVEKQANDGTQLDQEGARFFAAIALNGAWIEQQRQAGHVVRAWGFNSVDLATDPPANLPATDMPDADWYADYCAQIGCVD